ncbi:MAG: hypothetical protein ACFFBP_14845 [Promethearchaeota archaeon]
MQYPYFVSGILSLVLVIISIMVTTLIFYKYYKARRVDFIYFAISVMILSEPWWPGAISFIWTFFNNGGGIDHQLYRFLGNVFIPIGLFAWTLVCTNLIFTNKKKLLIWIVIVSSIIFEVGFFILFFTFPEYIGKVSGEVDIEYETFTLGYLLFVVAYILFTGINFALETIKTGSPEYILKGRLMIAGFILFCIGAGSDAIITIFPEMLLVTRIIIMISIIFLYLGFFLPKWMMDLLFKNK